MGDSLSDLDPRVALGAVMLALISGLAKACGEVLFEEIKLWLKEKMKRRRKQADLTPSCGRQN